MFHQMHLVSTSHLTEPASHISQQAMPTNKYLFNQAQAEATVHRIAHTKRKIFMSITVSNCFQQNYQQLHTRSLQTCDLTSHKALSFPSYSCIYELTEKLTSKISNLQLFEFSINNSSPFPMWCWFRNYAEKDSQVTILHLKDNIYIKIRNKKGTQKRFLLSRTQIFWD